MVKTKRQSYKWTLILLGKDIASCSPRKSFPELLGICFACQIACLFPFFSVNGSLRDKNLSHAKIKYMPQILLTGNIFKPTKRNIIQPNVLDALSVSIYFARASSFQPKSKKHILIGKHRTIEEYGKLNVPYVKVFENSYMHIIRNESSHVKIWYNLIMWEFWTFIKFLVEPRWWFAFLINGKNLHIIRPYKNFMRESIHVDRYKILYITSLLHKHILHLSYLDMCIF